jgi:leucyl-tRNA synthetase
MPYNPKRIEPKWQEYWQKNKTFSAQIDHKKKKFYCLDMFPYPSGSGLHVGHPEGYTATDILCRYKRMRGWNVLHTMGWDAFGLPAEQYAIKTGVHPIKTTKKNISNFKKQIQSLGFSYDWDRELNTTDPNYYRWTQWIFLKLYERGLAYQEESPVNWCPNLKAVLSHEEVEDGFSVEGRHPVYQKNLRQWKLRITAYADALLEGLDDLDWPNAILEMQKNWIGKSYGANAKFFVQDSEVFFEVFTTRADTLFGATYCVLAPEHPLLEKIVPPDYQPQVSEYQKSTSSKSERNRLAEQKEKSGVFTGCYAINPINDSPIPIWISDYVLMSYGTGAIMAVPAHDQRDYEFAKKFDLPICEVVSGGDITRQAYAGEGELINSGFLNKTSGKEAIQKAIDYLVSKKLGAKKTNYKLRDWLFSRQRYWGEPIPVLLDENYNSFPASEQELPVHLPHTDSFLPLDDGQSSLAKLKDWVEVSKNGKKYRRETNTMPQWAGSCWYYLRFLDPNNNEQIFSEEAEKYWMPVDLYVGGAEHAVLHLLYARFWHKVLYDCGLVHNKEPFQKLINQGMILGEDGQKMSKSRGNIVNPEDIIEEYGADAIRLYEMFMGPLEKVKPWQTNGVEGVFRFLNKVWISFVDIENKLLPSLQDVEPSFEDNANLHRSIKKVTQDIEDLKLNTAISELMIFMNYFSKREVKSLEIVRKFVLILAPFAPHLAEELWELLGHSDTLAYYSWPSYDEKYLASSQYTLPVQINGKVRFKMEVEKQLTKEDLVQKIQKEARLVKYFENKKIQKVVFIPEKIISFLLN